MALAATGSPDVAERVTEASALELKLAGINWAYSPVGDVNSDPRNPIIGSFLSTRHAIARTHIPPLQVYGLSATVYIHVFKMIIRATYRVLYISPARSREIRDRRLSRPYQSRYRTVCEALPRPRRHARRLTPIPPHNHQRHHLARTVRPHTLPRSM